jgi:hypothetical protein
VRETTIINLHAWTSKRQVAIAPREVSFSATSKSKFLKTPFELSRWRGGRCACDTPDIMDYHNVLNRLSPFSTKSKSFKALQAKVDSIPIA